MSIITVVLPLCAISLNGGYDWQRLQRFLATAGHLWHMMFFMLQFLCMYALHACHQRKKDNYWEAIFLDPYLQEKVADLPSPSKWECKTRYFGDVLWKCLIVAFPDGGADYAAASHISFGCCLISSSVCLTKVFHCFFKAAATGLTGTSYTNC